MYYDTTCNGLVPFPPIPAETFLHILEETRADKPTLLSLSLVSSWVHELAFPLLISTVTLTTSAQVTAFLRIIPLKPPEWWSKHLKNLWITYPDPSRLCSQIFKSLNIENTTSSSAAKIALQSSILHWKDDPSYALSPILKNCTDLTLLGPTFPYNFANAADVFKNITHLYLTEPLSGSKYTGKKIAGLPRLTHLAIPFQQPRGYAGDDFEEIKQVLLSTSLIMVVLHMNPKTWSKNCSGASDIHRSIDEWRIVAWKYDPRLYVLEAKTSLSHTEWEDAVRGGKGLWEWAENERLSADIWRMATSLTCCTL